MKSSAPSFRVLDSDALCVLSGESNSSKFAIDAHNRAVEELGDLSSLPKLCSLDVSFNRLASLQNLQTAKELRELKAYNNKLVSMLGLKGNPNLEGLLLHENQIEHISNDLLSLGRLKTLWLNGNRLLSVSNLGSCRLLVHLDLSRNQLSGAASEGLDNLTSLEYLNLSGNQLTSVGNLSALAKLEELNLADNRLTTLAGRWPANLVVLRVNGNQLTELTSIGSPLAKLSELYVQDNSVRDIKPLATLCPQLESLDVRNNSVAHARDVFPLAKCETLQDLWLESNPCCLSDRYLLDVVGALPGLKTLDTLSDVQLQVQVDKLRSGTISQDAALSSARPATPSTSRPGTPLSRPGSAIKSRPMTPTTRPGTADGAPVFHQPSSRIGTLVKLADPSEVAKRHDEVSERLHKMKEMLQRVGTPDNAGDRVRPSKRTAVVRHSDERADSTRRPHSDTHSPSVVATADATEEQPRQRRSTRIARLTVGVDAGTDPMDSLMGPTPPLSSRGPPPPRTTSHATETQTLMMPPAAPIENSQPNETDNNLVHGDLVEQSPVWEPEADALLIDKEMKAFLLQHAVEAETDNQLELLPHEEPTDSPRLFPVKSAELRPPPTVRSRQGYRSFRVPVKSVASDDI